MPLIRPSSDLRSKYNEISEFCRQHDEPVYITKSGHGDLAVMSIAAYERLLGKFELYKLLDEGMGEIRNNQLLLAEDVFGLADQDLERVRLTQMATGDLKEIVSYLTYELQEPSLAKNLVLTLKEIVTKLEKNSTTPVVADQNLARQGIRKSSVDNCLIFYTLPEKEMLVTVVRIIYGKREWEDLL